MKRRAKRLLNDLDQEIREHIELATQENIDRGMTPEEARHAAVRKFGNVTRAKEDAREVWSTVWLEQLKQDIRFGLRQLWKSPAFTTVAILTLALGIGANTAIYSFMESILLRSLPVADPESLVVLNWHSRPPEDANKEWVHVMHSVSRHCLAGRERRHGQRDVPVRRVRDASRGESRLFHAFRILQRTKT